MAVKTLGLGQTFYEREVARIRKGSDEPELLEVASSSSPASVPGKIIELPPRSLTGSFKIEMAAGADFPVVVANRKHVHREAIEFRAENGSFLRLVRLPDRLLPSAEHYRYFLWFLDRCQSAADHGAKEPPRIPIDLGNIYELFGRSKGGTFYREVDEAFRRFSGLTMTARSAFMDKGRLHELETDDRLLSYTSWRSRPKTGSGDWELEKAFAVPGHLLWNSIISGYVMSVPLEPLRKLESYVAQRLYMHLAKHCTPGKSYTVALTKLLPRIPLHGCKPKEVKQKLKNHHQALLDVGFLKTPPEYRGRGEDRKIIYTRAAKMTP